MPAGRRQLVNWIDARDIAEVAALVLADPEPHHGQGATEDPTMARLLGRPGRSIETYIHDHAHLWARPSGARAA